MAINSNIVIKFLWTLNYTPIPSCDNGRSRRIHHNWRFRNLLHMVMWMIFRCDWRIQIGVGIRYKRFTGKVSVRIMASMLQMPAVLTVRTFRSLDDVRLGFRIGLSYGSMCEPYLVFISLDSHGIPSL